MNVRKVGLSDHDTKPVSSAVQDESNDTRVSMHADVMTCFQCGKCSSGCPITHVTDLQPHKIVQSLQLGMPSKLLQSKHLWLCMSCHTCFTRCPNEIDLPSIIDYYRQQVWKQNKPVSVATVQKFHRAFKNNIQRHGRVFEFGLLATLRPTSGNRINDIRTGLKMLARGKLKLRPYSKRRQS